MWKEKSLCILVLSLNCIVDVCNAKDISKKYSLDGILQDQDTKLNCSEDDITVDLTKGKRMEIRILPMENCADRRDRSLYAVCYLYLNKPPKSFSFRFIDGFDTVIPAMISESRFVRNKDKCVLRTTAKLRIPQDKLTAGSALIWCTANDEDNGHFSSQTTPIRMHFLPCPPKMNFNFNPSTLNLGNQLTVTCQTTVGPHGHVIWVLINEDDEIHVLHLHYENARRYWQDNLILSERNRTDPVAGPITTSSLTMTRPLLHNKTRIACLSAEDPLDHEILSGENLVKVTEPISVTLPGLNPVVTIYYHDPPNTVYIGENLTAICAAQLYTSDNKQLVWDMYIDGKVYSWAVSEQGVTESHNSPGKPPEGVHAALKEEMPHENGKHYLVIELSVPVRSIHCVYSHLGCHQKFNEMTYLDTNSQDDLFQVKYAPQPPRLTSKYISVNDWPYIEIVCESYVGTDGYHVWWLWKSGGLNVTWGYNTTRHMFGDVEGRVKHLPPTSFFDDLDGPALKTVASIQINYLVDHAKVTCVSTLAPNIHQVFSGPRTYQESLEITLKDTTKEFSKIWSDTSYKEIGWVLLILLLVVVAVIAVMNTVDCVLGQQFDSLSPPDSCTSTPDRDREFLSPYHISLCTEPTRSERRISF